MADKVLRVLCAASREWPQLPPDFEPDTLNDLTFIGLTGMIDPVRPQVKDAIAECRHDGIRPVMITGDHKDTAVAIARELGIITDASQAVTGARWTASPTMSWIRSSTGTAYTPVSSRSTRCASSTPGGGGAPSPP